MEENLKQLTVNPEISDIIKIAVYGPESTGKTTLATQLAGHFNTVWAPEFARDYLQGKWEQLQTICDPEDIMPIAYGQTALENHMLQQAEKFLFSDTCLLQTKVYSDIYYGTSDPQLEKAARKHKYDLFFLTDIDVPWEKDDLRDRPNDRETIFATFKKALDDAGKPYIVLSGNAEARFHKAVSILDTLELAKRLGFSSHDFIQIYNYGIPIETIENHLDIFKKGISKSILDRPATAGDGIMRLSDEEFLQHARYFDGRRTGLKLEKFVPASGAASRMFKFLNEFLNEFDVENETINAYINRKNALNLNIFLAGKEKFPFFKIIIERLFELYPDAATWERSKRNYHFIKLMLGPGFFDFCNKPKGVLPFHSYDGYVATAVEEHLSETVWYSRGADSITNLHFTVSENHRDQFEAIIASVKEKIEKRSGARIYTSFSYQHKSTDTIAVDKNNMPFRDQNGSLVFRPGGHGALIENLDRIDADVIFIKNIDNVIQNHVETIALYKKALAGVLLETQEAIFGCLEQIENNNVKEKDIDEMTAFITKRLNMQIVEDFPKYTLAHKRDYIKTLLDRPVRVCGMVKNEGEPGGGPFWIRNSKGILVLQIVESSQVDLQNQHQSKVLAASTHFNPVDLVCGVRNYKGEKFHLTKFVDHNSGFIVSKTKNGRPLKGYELPGLWNGAMAKWITIFVEVPLITFNPVKTVNDLLKPAHQPQ
jgi:nicotinamide riboside kinase